MSNIMKRGFVLIAAIALCTFGCGGGGGGGADGGAAAGNGAYVELTGGSQSVPTGTLTGFVGGQDFVKEGGTEKTDGDAYALGGATITISHPTLIEGGSAVVNIPEDGSYQIVLPAGTGYTLVFNMPGYEPVTFTGVEVIAGQTISLEEVVLKNNSVTVRSLVAGTITDGSGGLGSVAVTIQCTDCGEGSSPIVIYTASDGTYSVYLDAGHCYTISYALSGYQTAEPQQICITSDGTVTGFNDTTTLDPVPTTATVSGTILGQKISGAAAAGIEAKIYITQNDAAYNTFVTGSDGSYSFVLPPGTYKAKIVAVGYTDISIGEFTVIAGQTVTFDYTMNLVTGTIKGTVKDTTGTGVSGVDVKIYYQEGTAVLAQTSTDSAGSLSITLPLLNADNGDYYRAVFTKDGYETVVYYIYDMYQNYTISLQPVVIVVPGVGSVSGFIRSSIDGRGVANATVKLRSGMGTKTGAYVSGAQSVTGSDGGYGISSLAAGNYTAEVTCAGYSIEYFNVVCEANKETGNQNCIISPSDAYSSVSGRIEIKLSWGSSPSDIDAHFTAPNPGGSGRLHLYYVYSQEYIYSGDPVANRGYNNWQWKDLFILDIDDRYKYGPETVTIKQPGYVSSLVDKVYAYAVHDFTNRDRSYSTALSGSGAVVTLKRYDLLDGSGNPATLSFYIPQNKVGTVWKVMEMHYNDAYLGKLIIVPKDEFYNVESPSAVLQ